MQNTAPMEQAAAVKRNISLPHSELEEPIIELAQKLATCTARRASFHIPARLQQFMDFFQECYEYFDEATKAKVSISQTAEWLLDNFYVIEQAIRQVQEDLRADYYQRLPKTRDGWARIYIVALANTQHEDTRLDIEQIKNFLQTFQNVTPLSTGELWALPLMLRLSMFEALAEALANITKLTWEAIPQPNLSGMIETSAFPAPQAVSESIVANSILDLRLLATQDWKAFFESTSILEKLLRDDPACRVHEYPVAAAVLARRDVVGVRLPLGADDLAAWHVQQHDDGRQVLEQREVLRGRQRPCEERRERENQGPYPGMRDQGASHCIRLRI